MFCQIDVRNQILFSKNLLLLAFSTILYNAIHSSVKARKIIINVYQKRLNNDIVIEISNDGEVISNEIRKKIFKGVTSKKDGNGLGLKNLKKLLKESGSDLILLNDQKTIFSFNIKASITKKLVKDEFKLSKKSMDNITTTNEKFVLKEGLPFVVIIEDEELIWDAWNAKMHDANKLFFRTPDEFFLHSDIEKYHGREFISKITMIICDYDFGNNVNLSNSGFFNTLERETEKFNGKFVLCTGFNESIFAEIPDRIKDKINIFFQKKPTSFEEISSVDSFSKYYL